MKQYNLLINEKLSNLRLDKAASLILVDISRSQIQKAIEGGKLKLNGAITYDSSIKVKLNDEIEIDILSPAPNENMLPANINLDIVYEDEDLIILNKQAGLVVHPGVSNHQNTLANALLFHTTDLSDVGGQTRPGIVHRLDKDTSGLMVVAKNNIMHAKLSSLIEKREITRKYKAIVFGHLLPSVGTIQTNIGRSRIDRLKMAVVKTGGKTAITHYQIEAVYQNGLFSLVSCKLETGRTHQIRVHLSHMGHSIVGDQTYGNNKRKLSQCSDAIKDCLANFKRQALHSSYIGFIHPKSGEFLEFTSKLPADIQSVVETLSQEIISFYSNYKVYI